MNEDSYTREVIIQMLEAAIIKFETSPNTPAQIIDDLIIMLNVPQSKYNEEECHFNLTIK